MRVRTLLNPYKCHIRSQQQNWYSIFPAFNETIDVEIGFGNGKFIQTYASANPNRHLVGFEIRHKHVALVQEKIAASQYTNTVVFRANGLYGLSDMFKDESIDRIFIFHPDPWLKHNQQKRLLVSPEFLACAYQKLKSSGSLYIATDVEFLWHFMERNITHSGLFDQNNDELFWQTHYQTRWKEMSLDHKRTLFYGTFVKVASCTLNR